MFTLQAKLQDLADNRIVHWIAAAPADRMHSFTGSGLPFANREQAFHNTPNKGTVRLEPDNSFTLELYHPNSFYDHLGTDLVPPTVFLTYTSGGQEKHTHMRLGNSIPFRMLTYPKTQTRPRTDAMFYDNHARLPVRTQEQILLDSAYPTQDIMPENFWGLKPAL